jgi:HPt (histidine-containing phosphotransfer) domain-containing protein
VPSFEAGAAEASEVMAQRAVARLPAAALASLRDAFADEVNERLPRLRVAVRAADADLLREALRDVHTLGSSAYVVGEVAAARAARAAEAVLVDEGPVPRFAELVRDLDAQLAGWLR